MRSVLVLSLIAAALTGDLLARASRPDLVESSVAVSRRTAAAGSSLRVRDAVENRGGHASAPSASGYYLSRDRARGPSDRRLGRRPVAALEPGRVSRGSKFLRIPRSTRPGAYRLLVCADDRRSVREAKDRNNCRPTPAVRVIGDARPPKFEGLHSATTCLPGPVGGERSSPYHLVWSAAADDVTPPRGIVYDVYHAITEQGETFSTPTYTTRPGVTSFTTPPLPSSTAHYFVVRARDAAGNRDSNRIEQRGENLCL